MRCLLAFCAALACAGAASAAPLVCIDIRSLGAQPGGQENYLKNTAAIRSALEIAASPVTEPTCVNVTGGDYATEDLVVTSNITLHVHSDARLMVALNKTSAALVHVLNAHNVTVTGGGMLYGNAEHCIAGFIPIDDEFIPWNGTRPHLLLVDNSSSVTISNIRVHNSSNWNLRLRASRDVLVDGVSVYGSHQFPNNDGIDPESSVGVTIINCNVDVADDGVCLKSTVGLGPLANVYVHNTTIRSRSHAIKFGSNTDEDMYNIVFDNITIHDSNGGMSIQQRSAGTINNVTWSNVNVQTRYTAPRWWGNGEWITISAQPRYTGHIIGNTTNLRFINITGESENAALISGLAHGVQNLTLENINIKIVAQSNYSTGKGPPCMSVMDGHDFKCMGSLDHRPSIHPGSCSHYCRTPSVANGLYLEHVLNATLTNVTIDFQTPRTDWFGTCYAQDATTVGVRNVGFRCLNSKNTSAVAATDRPQRQQ